MAACNNVQFLQSRFQKIREDIEIRFKHVMQLIEERKHNLFQLLEDIMSEYEKKHGEFSEAIDLLEFHKSQVADSLDNTLLDGLVSNQIAQLDRKISALKIDFKEPDINWKWNENKVKELVNSLGQINSGGLNIANDVTIPDYRAKKVPQVCAVNRGNNRGEICDPRGISIDSRSGNIYVADYGANRASVFSPNYEFLFQFGAEGGFGKMDRPHGINVFQDKVYVTLLSTHRVQIYTLNGVCTNWIGSHGNRPGEFNSPGDTFIDDTNDDIYICDSANHRVQVFAADLKFKSIFSGKFKDPLRGRVYKNFVIVLDNSNPSLHFYSKAGEWFRSILHKELLSIGIRRFFDFEVDTECNIIIADVNLHCVSVVDSRGKIVHQFGCKGEKPGQLNSPWGVTLTKGGNIVVLTCNEFGCLKVF